MLLGYAKHNVSYRFLILKSDVIEHNIIMEKNKIEFFKHIFPLKVSVTCKQPLDMSCVRIWKEVKDSENKLLLDIYLVDNDLTSFVRATSVPNAKQRYKAIRTKIDLIKKKKYLDLSRFS